MAVSLEGNWRSGKAYDVHTVSSMHIGIDELGHDRFETKRTEMGELLYRLKYTGDRSATETIIELLDAIKGIETFDCIVPIPPTNKQRTYQPVEMIALALGDRRNVSVLTRILVSEGNEELKGITDPIAREEMLKHALRLTGKGDIAGKKVLLVDDLYRSGSTLRIATDLLYREGKAEVVSVLTMTKTRSNR